MYRYINMKHTKTGRLDTENQVTYDFNNLRSHLVAVLLNGLHSYQILSCASESGRLQRDAEGFRQTSLITSALISVHEPSLSE